MSFRAFISFIYVITFIGIIFFNTPYFLWPPHAKSWLIGKDPDTGRGWGQEEKGMTEDEVAGWHHGHEFE